MPPKRSLANAMGLISIMFDGLGWLTGNLIYVSARLLFSLWYIPGALSSEGRQAEFLVFLHDTSSVRLRFKPDGSRKALAGNVCRFAHS
jgi:hypothetical protein